MGSGAKPQLPIKGGWQHRRSGAGAAVQIYKRAATRAVYLANGNPEQRSNFHKGAPAARRENWLSARESAGESPSGISEPIPHPPTQSSLLPQGPAFRPGAFLFGFILPHSGLFCFTGSCLNFNYDLNPPSTLLDVSPLPLCGIPPSGGNTPPAAPSGCRLHSSRTCFVSDSSGKVKRRRSHYRHRAPTGGAAAGRRGTAMGGGWV